MDQVHIEKTVQEALAIPLYGTDGPPCYDFGQIEKRFQSLMRRFGALEAA